jgi:hypothetical protein
MELPNPKIEKVGERKFHGHRSEGRREERPASSSVIVQGSERFRTKHERLQSFARFSTDCRSFLFQLVSEFSFLKT